MSVFKSNVQPRVNIFRLSCERLGFSEGVLFTQSRCYVDLSLVRQGAECSQAAKATMVAGQSTLNAQSSCVDGSFHGLLFGDAQCHNDAGQWPGLLWNKKRG